MADPMALMPQRAGAWGSKGLEGLLTQPKPLLTTSTTPKPAKPAHSQSHLNQAAVETSQNHLRPPLATPWPTPWN